MFLSDVATSMRSLPLKNWPVHDARLAPWPAGDLTRQLRVRAWICLRFVLFLWILLGYLTQ